MIVVVALKNVRRGVCVRDCVCVCVCDLVKLYLVKLCT